jgi:hypothetical protein
VLFTIVLRISNVPKVELLGGSEVKSRTRFGGERSAHNIEKFTAKMRCARLVSSGSLVQGAETLTRACRRAVGIDEHEVSSVVVGIFEISTGRATPNV